MTITQDSVHQLIPPSSASPDNSCPLNEDHPIIDDDDDYDEGDEPIFEKATKPEEMRKAAAIWILKTQEVNKLLNQQCRYSI